MDKKLNDYILGRYETGLVVIRDMVFSYIIGGYFLAILYEISLFF